MASRPIWTGAISFGLLNIPVQLEKGYVLPREAHADRGARGEEAGAEVEAVGFGHKRHPTARKRA